jgi:hypothetical protein
VDTDILKPDTGSIPFERPSQLSSILTSAEGSSGSHTPPGPQGYTEPISEGEEDEEMDLTPAKDEHKRTGLSGAEVDEAIAFREKMLKERQRQSDYRENGELDPRTPFLKVRRTSSTLNESSRTRALAIDPLAPSHTFDETLRDRLSQEHSVRKDFAPIDERGDEGDVEETDALLPSDERILTRDFSAPRGKRIAVPVRIEPKVYFAQERTFLVIISSFIPFTLSHGISLKTNHKNRMLASVEMATLFHLHRHNRYRFAQFHGFRRQSRADRGWHVYVGCTAHNRVLCHYLRLSCIEAENAKCGRNVL